MTEVISVALNDEIRERINHLKKGKVSKFIRERILSDILPNRSSIVMGLDSGKIKTEDLYNLIDIIKSILEVREV